MQLRITRAAQLETLAFGPSAWQVRNTMFSRPLRAALLASLLTAIGVPACGGGSSDSGAPSSAGASTGGGPSSAGRQQAAGASGKPAEPISCGNKTCKDVLIAQANFTIPGCCADPATSQCGLDSSVLAAFGPTFPEACQPLAQPGSVDKSCPASPATPVSGTGFTINFPGCCRPDNRCGFQLDSIPGFIQLGLGCVDSAPFVDGGTAPSCTAR